MAMDAFKAVHDYINKILTQTGIIGVVYSQSSALSKEVYLTENVDTIANNPESHHYSFPHLTAVVIVQPTAKTLQSLLAILGLPRYHQYHLFFTNIVNPDYLDQLAAADHKDYIKSVYEYYMDFYALTPLLFHLNNNSDTAAQRSLTGPNHYISFSDKQSAMFDRDVAGVIALCLSQKKRPDIRYASSSHQAQTVALQCYDLMKNESELFSFNDSQNNNPAALLLILDRRDDPVTPLLTQWTYQAMIHELLTITNNRIDMGVHNPALKSQPSASQPSTSKQQQIRRDLQELVLSHEHDSFFSENMFATFGEMGVRVKALVTHYQSVTHSNHKLDSIDALQDFVDKYPQYRQLSGNVSKHVTLMTELSKIVNQRKLLIVSALEQEIVCGSAHEHDEVASKMRKLLLNQYDPNNPETNSTHTTSTTAHTNPNSNTANATPPTLTDSSTAPIYIEFDDKLRVVLLYALRYSTHETSYLSEFASILSNQCVDALDRQKLATIDALLEYYNHTTYHQSHTVNTGNSMKQQRNRELFENSMIRSLFKAVASEIKGVENIYTQHKPWLLNIVTKLLTGDLRLPEYPFVGPSTEHHRIKYKNVIVYMIGGVTYEEYCALEGLMQSNATTITQQSSATTNPSSSSSSHYESNPTSSIVNRPSSGMSTSGSNSGGSSDKKQRFDNVIGAVKNVGVSVGGAFGQIGSAVGTATATIKFNPKEYRVLLGGSCVHNSKTFLHEIFPIEEDIFIKGKQQYFHQPQQPQQYIQATAITPAGEEQGYSQTAGYAQVPQQPHQQQHPPQSYRGGRGRGGYLSVPQSGRGRGVAPPIRGVPSVRGVFRGGIQRGGGGRGNTQIQMSTPSTTTSPSSSSSPAVYRSQARPAGHGY